MILKLNPVTRKRLERFKSIKRAYWSFWILLITFLISLGAELYCNNVPLYVHFEGKSYYPILKDYSKKDFYPDGDSTKVDYKDLRDEDFYKKNPSNSMLFPLIPYGAKENVPISKIDVSKDITLEISKEPEVGTIDITPEFDIRAFAASEFFLTAEQEYRKLPLKELIKFSAEFKSAVNDRLANKTSAQYAEESLINDKKIKLVLIPFEARDAAPKKIRIRIESVKDPKAPATGFEESVVYSELLEPVKGQPKIWPKLSEEQKMLIKEKLKDRLNDFVDPIYLTVDEQSLVIKFNRILLNFPVKPLQNNYLGFDEAGRDVLAQIIYGFRIAISFALILVVFTIVIGVAIGGLQGYFGGPVDLLGQRAIEIWASLPFLYVMILLGSIYGRSFMLLLFVYGIFNWIGISYYMRAEFLKLRKASYVEAAKCLGLSNLQIMWKHILPNAMVPIITFFPFMLVGAIGSLTSLDFLGFGLPPGTPSWGNLISQGVTHKGAWWLIFYPSLFLFLVIFLAILIGDGLRAAFDPRKFHKID